MNLQSIFAALSELLSSLFRFQSAAQGTVNANVFTPVTRKVSMIIFNPSIPSAGNARLIDVMQWNNPDTLAANYIQDLQTSSSGYVNYTIVERLEADAFPLKEDKFRYDPDAYYKAIQSGTGFHQPDTADYYDVIKTYDLINKVNCGAIDEVWVFGCPYAGFYESRMAGPNAFFCNAPPLLDLPDCERRFMIMGFSYQRGNGEMLESMSHRTEYIMAEVFSHTSAANNLWQRFTRYDKAEPGQAEVGTVHYAPNSQHDYDWGNTTNVPSRCKNWLKYPDLSGDPVSVNCTEWGNGDIRGHHLWWLSHLPHIAGITNSIANNWWIYTIDPNQIS